MSGAVRGRSTPPEDDAPPLWLGEGAVRAALKWEVIVPAMRAALEAVTKAGEEADRADIVQPPRSWLEDSINEGTLLTMPALHRPSCSLAVKLLTIFPRNAAEGRPPLQSLVTLMDSSTGALLALVHGNSLTEIRTAAASAAATTAVRTAKGLPPTVGVVAVLGAGVQAASHARALYWSCRPQKVTVWARTAPGVEGAALPSPKATALVQQLLEEGIPAEASGSVEECVKEADVVCCCTSATSPILRRAWLRDHVHVNSVGGIGAEAQDIASDVMLAAEVFPDVRSAAETEAGNVINSGARLVAEIGDVMRGKAVPRKNKISVFESLGFAAEDAIAARIVYDHHKATQGVSI